MVREPLVGISDLPKRLITPSHRSSALHGCIGGVYNSRIYALKVGLPNSDS